ncbi:MAG: hypothetical protein AABX03_04795 [Nanoarchaeota archaeon]
MEFVIKKDFYADLIKRFDSYLKWSIGEYEMVKLQRLSLTVDHYYSREKAEVECSSDDDLAYQEVNFGIDSYYGYINCIGGILSEIKRKRLAREYKNRPDNDLLLRESGAFRTLVKEYNLAIDDVRDLEDKLSELRSDISQGKQEQSLRTIQL